MGGRSLFWGVCRTQVYQDFPPCFLPTVSGTVTSENPLAPCSRLWYCTATFTRPEEDSPPMKLKLSAPIVQKFQSATPPPTNVLVGLRSDPRPVTRGVPRFHFSFPIVFARSSALAIAAIILALLAGCGGEQTPPPRVEVPRGIRSLSRPRRHPRGRRRQRLRPNPRLEPKPPASP